MNDLNVIDLAFLKGFYESPTLALICKEPHDKLIAKLYEVDQNTKELTNTLWKKEINDNQAFLIAGLFFLIFLITRLSLKHSF